MSLNHQSVYPSQPLDRQGAPIQELDRGITLLQHYAGLAMQGFMANPQLYNIKSNGFALEPPMARHAISAAKALIAELEKEGQK